MHVPHGDIHDLKPSSSWRSNMCMVNTGQHCQQQITFHHSDWYQAVSGKLSEWGVEAG